MSDHSFDAFSRRAADAVSRRNSILTLGGAAVAASMMKPAATEAKKGGKKGKKCKNQVGKCKEGLQDLCVALTTEFSIEFSAEVCFELFAECCEFLKGCNAGQAFQCAVDVVESLDM